MGNPTPPSGYEFDGGFIRNSTTGSLLVDGTIGGSTTVDVTDRAGRLLGHITVDSSVLPAGAAQDASVVTLDTDLKARLSPFGLTSRMLAKTPQAGWVMWLDPGALVDQASSGAHTTSTGSQALNAATINVTTTTPGPNFPSAGQVVILGQVITYTGITATSLTGCTGGVGGAGTLPAGTPVGQATAGTIMAEAVTGAAASASTFQGVFIPAAAGRWSESTGFTWATRGTASW